ncbi:MAG: DNA translocase FtsK 4TM domain-containing protein, partial [Oligoflexia bacterium]|nr:DNA translocase FtsK 4TM domain-containing protein [Oligoflexia bacterium]
VGLSLKVSNLCGFIGASLADLLYQLFGFSAWLIILGGLGLAYSLLVHSFREKSLNFSSISLFLLGLLSLTSLFELHLPNIHFFNQEVSLGGAFGEMTVSLLKPLLHTTGTAVILWSAFFLVLISYGQILFSPSLIFLPKKLLISFSFALRKCPQWIMTGFLSFKKAYISSVQLIKNASAWLKNKFLFLKRSLFQKKQELSAHSSAQSTSAEIQTEPNPNKPQFTFKESFVLNTTDTKKPAIEEDSPDENSIYEEEDSLKERPKYNEVIWNGLPSIDILSDNPAGSKKINSKDVEDLSKKLIDKLAQFSIKGEIKAIKTGPALVLFEFKPEDHVKVSKIREMESDLSLALSSESVRIIAPIPGRDVVGIEASMPYREMVYLKTLLKQEDFLKAQLPLVLGRRADNRIGIKDLARIPHLLVAGTTGSGKSMFIISFISSLLFRHSPESLRLLLIDPKQVDLSSFKEVPHLLSPIITSSHSAVGALQWAIQEMEKRYRSLSYFKARDCRSFNEIVQKLSTKEKYGNEEKNKELTPHSAYYFEPLPLICIVIEEFGDLMADREVRRSIENSVVRLAQKARASGIHLVLAMQSPRKDVVTGLIKTNIPGRISFKVASGTDSRVILDDTGAERLLSHGDMLFLEPGSLKATRYHGPYMREKEVSAIAGYWREQSEPLYEESLLNTKKKRNANDNTSSTELKQDPMYNEILEFVKTCDVISASFLQRRFQIGYPRAGRIIEALFEAGQIGPAQGSKPREVLISK